MSFTGDRALPAPVDVAGASFVVVREVRCFSANSSAALQTAINVWLATLRVSPTEYFVVSITPYSASNNNHSAVVSYGYFVPA